MTREEMDRLDRFNRQLTDNLDGLRKEVASLCVEVRVQNEIVHSLAADVKGIGDTLYAENGIKDRVRSLWQTRSAVVVGIGLACTLFGGVLTKVLF